MKSFLISALYMQANSLFINKKEIASDATQKFDLSDDSVLKTVKDAGLDLEKPQILQVNAPAGTGFIWMHQIHPVGCAKIKELTNVKTVERVMPGFSKKQLYEVSSGLSSSSECQVTMALARPWIFAGFNDDGTLKDASTAHETLTIPLHLQ